MPGSNEGLVVGTGPMNRMTQVVRYGAQTGKTVIQTAGQLGVMAVTAGLSQFSPGVQGHQNTTEDPFATNATRWDQSPTNQYYIFGGLGLIGAMVLSVVFVYPLLRRLCGGNNAHVGSSGVSVSEFHHFVAKHSGKNLVEQAEAGIQADEPMIAGSFAVGMEPEVLERGVSFSVGSDNMSDATQADLPTIVELDETYDNDGAVLVDDRKVKKEELGRVRRATKVLERMIARPEEAAELSVRYRELLSSVS